MRKLLALTLFVASAAACSAPEPTDAEGLQQGLRCAGNGAGDTCHPTCPCPAGGGDCDSNAECQPGLVCANDLGARFGMSASMDVCVPAHCTNGVQDAGETGPDTGGACGGCPANGQGDSCSPQCPCASGGGDCDSPADCQSGLVCVDDRGARFGMKPLLDVCTPNHCANGVQDAAEGETGIDTGPPCCPGNGQDFTCSSACLCASGWGDCDGSAQCQMGLVCPTQPNGAKFGMNAASQVCIPAHCTNGRFDPGSSEIQRDCGGPCGTCETSCTNGVDDDGDGLADCLDPECPPCPGETSCTNGVDDEGDGLVDCLDPECPRCPAEASCTNGLDDDGDGLVDCRDSECPSCPTPAIGALSVGGSHACALEPAGSVVCWGSNVSKAVPPPSGPFEQISVGPVTCGVRPDGAGECWGNVGGDDPHLFDAPPGAYAQISTSGISSYVCAVRADETLSCWGGNPSGAATPPSGAFMRVVTGEDHSCGFRPNGALVCWGSNANGKATPPSGTFIDVALSKDYTCAVRDNGFMVCWGNTLAAPSGTFTRVTSGWEHSCALRTDGTITCWGRNLFGQNDSPPGVFTTLESGASTACAVRTDGQTLCWGAGPAGLAIPPGGVFQQIQSGSDRGVPTACRLGFDGKVSCWGNNGLDDWPDPVGTYTRISSDTPFVGCGLKADQTIGCWGNPASLAPPSGTFASVEVSGLWQAGFPLQLRACAIRTNGTLTCWGNDGVALRPPPAGTFKQVSKPGNYACAIRTDDALVCWGGNPFNQIPPSGTFRQVATARNHACAVRTDGSLACWGSNEFGETSPPAGTFTKVELSLQWGSCGLRADGTIACWGANDNGNLGPPPTQPTGTFIDLSVAENTRCGLRPDGTEHCWGQTAR
jgi:alpha-tubulin suppressor-like RCC1 family protein